MQITKQLIELSNNGFLIVVVESPVNIDFFLKVRIDLYLFKD